MNPVEQDVVLALGVALAIFLGYVGISLCRWWRGRH